MGKIKADDKALDREVGGFRDCVRAECGYLRLFICTVLFVLVAGAADEIRAEVGAEISAEVRAEVRADIRELRADIKDLNKKLDTKRDEIQAEVSAGIKELQTKRKKADSAFTFVILMLLLFIPISLALLWWT